MSNGKPIVVINEPSFSMEILEFDPVSKELFNVWLDRKKITKGAEKEKAVKKIADSTKKQIKKPKKQKSKELDMKSIADYIYDNAEEEFTTIDSQALISKYYKEHNKELTRKSIECYSSKCTKLLIAEKRIHRKSRLEFTKHKPDETKSDEGAIRTDSLEIINEKVKEVENDTPSEPGRRGRHKKNKGVTDNLHDIVLRRKKELPIVEEKLPAEESVEQVAEKNEPIQLGETVKAPNNTALFLNWLHDKQCKSFDIRDFVNAHPEITLDDAKLIAAHQIKKNKCIQLSTFNFKVV
jgi:hypothetical protein